MIVLTGFLLVTEFAPRLGVLWTRYEALQTHQDRLATAENWQHEKVAVSRRRQQLRAAHEALFVSVPRSDQMSAVIGELQAAADSAGVLVLEIRPEDRGERTAYDVLPVHVEVEGGFNAVGDYLARVERSRYVMRTQRVALTAPAEVPGPVHAELDVRVVILQEEAG
ncbi:MAG: type 4a pilus biogenesis protein PilO [Bacteroidota bacterium]